MSQADNFPVWAVCAYPVAQFVVMQTSVLLADLPLKDEPVCPRCACGRHEVSGIATCDKGGCGVFGDTLGGLTLAGFDSLVSRRDFIEFDIDVWVDGILLAGVEDG